MVTIDNTTEQMVKLDRITDCDAILQFITRDDIWHTVCEDNTDKDLNLVVDSCQHWLMSQDKGALFLIHPHNSTTCVIHTNVIAEKRHNSKLYAREALKYFTESGFMKMNSEIPDFNMPAYYFALKMGMKHEGVSRQSFTKNGKQCDTFLVGITKQEAEEFLCQ